MRVIPTDDPMLRIFLVFNFVNVFPCVLRECDMSACLFGIQPGDASLDLDYSRPIVPDEHAADFRLGGGAPVLPNLPHHLAINQ
jgi:hypothetical protein